MQQDKKSYSEFGKLLRIVVCSLYEENEIKTELKSMAIRVSIKPDAMVVLRKVVKLVMLTDFTCQFTKLYLSMPNITYTDLSEQLMSPANVIKGRVWSDIKKLRDMMGDEALNRLIYYGDNIDKCNDLLDGQLANYTDDTLLSDFIIDLKEKPVKTDVSDDTFDTALKAISPYSKGYAGLVVRSLGDDVLQYINYLVNNKELLDEDDLIRYNKLKDII